MLNTCFDLMSGAISTYISNINTISDTTYNITSRTVPHNPTSLTDTNLMAEVIPEFGTIIAKRIDTKYVFVENNGDIRSDIVVNVSSENTISLQPPDNIESNSASHCIDSSVPYLAKFLKENMSKSNITLHIESIGPKMDINALRIIQMPPISSVSIESINVDVGYPITQIGDTEFRIVDGDIPIESTVPAYIHFQHTTAKRINISLNSDVYLSKHKAVIVGVNQIIGEMNIYSKESYIGYKIPFPEYSTGISSIIVSPDNYSTSLYGVSCKAYLNESDYNSMNDSFTVGFASTYYGNIAKGSNDYLYLLLKIETSNNLTPSIGGISVEFNS